MKIKNNRDVERLFEAQERRANKFVKKHNKYHVYLIDILIVATIVVLIWEGWELLDRINAKAAVVILFLT